MRPRSRVPRGVLAATGAVVLVVAGIAGYLGFGYSPWVAMAVTLLTLSRARARAADGAAAKKDHAGRPGHAERRPGNAGRSSRMQVTPSRVRSASRTPGSAPCRAATCAHVTQEPQYRAGTWHPGFQVISYLRRDPASLQSPGLKPATGAIHRPHQIPH